jgi:hypothetical protein
MIHPASLRPRPEPDHPSSRSGPDGKEVAI